MRTFEGVFGGYIRLGARDTREVIVENSLPGCGCFRLGGICARRDVGEHSNRPSKRLGGIRVVHL